MTTTPATAEPIDPKLPRRLLDVACRIRAGESLFRDDELVDAAAHALKSLLATPAEIAQPATPEPAEARLPRWIRVEDRLPTHRHSVLGVVVDGPMVVAGDHTDRLVDIVSYGGPGDPRWLQFTGGEDAVVAVTHWMPRPPLPDSREQRKHDAAVAIAGPMARSFEVHTGVSWTDPEWRQETALWAAAWRLATQPATHVAHEREREAFEAEQVRHVQGYSHGRHMPHLERTGAGYQNPLVHAAWQGWQARAALATQAASSSNTSNTSNTLGDASGPRSLSLRSDDPSRDLPTSEASRDL